MIITIITLFPEMFQGPFAHSIIKNAIGKNLVKINFVNMRNFGIGKHKIVDDKPYGGGKGMIIRVDVLNSAIEYAKKMYKTLDKYQKIILLDPTGRTFNQKVAFKLSKVKHLIMICGHYEGFDARIKIYVDDIISIGDFISTGGEIPAMLITDSIIRLIKGVLPENVITEESFSTSKKQAFLEHPQYTRPKVYKKYKVPEVLLSGDHQKIADFRKKSSRELTSKIRPDLLKT
ncbi:MAG: tRNA (guanosine(37)-N1)-methyltransferase TrmD [Candidatus Levybacteria bacterium]|nr:tRNA (guanosine(37)-N1)-methyltransferase TrmD [Candidatus Levybacteria bacterium]